MNRLVFQKAPSGQCGRWIWGMRLELGDQERILQVSGRGPRGEGLEPSLFQVVGFCLPSALTSYPASHLAPGVPCGLDSTHSAGTWHSPLGAAGCEEPCLFSPSSQQHYKSMEQKPSLPLSSEPAVVAPWMLLETGVWLKADKERK